MDVFRNSLSVEMRGQFATHYDIVIRLRTGLLRHYSVSDVGRRQDRVSDVRLNGVPVRIGSVTPFFDVVFYGDQRAVVLFFFYGEFSESFSKK